MLYNSKYQLKESKMYKTQEDKYLRAKIRDLEDEIEQLKRQLKELMEIVYIKHQIDKTKGK